MRNLRLVPSLFLVAGLVACGGSVDTPDAGACKSCPVWSVLCNGDCVDLTASTRNCGGCGAACDGRTQVCRGGVCVEPARCASIPGVGDNPDGGVEAGAGLMGLRGEYYGATDLTTLKLVRLDAQVDFVWTDNGPDPSVGKENYSVRWTGKLTPQYSETYTLHTRSDDGVRLYIDGNKVIDDWSDHGVLDDAAMIALDKSRTYDVRLEYYQGTGGAEIHFEWESAHQMREVVPTSQLAPSVGPAWSCAGGECCNAGGALPVCCPAGSRCVVNSTFAGCCPTGESCGEAQTCGH